MNAVRAFLPTDLPALVAHSGLGSENEAWPRERLGAGESQATLSVVRDQLLSFARRRGAWVCVRRQRLQGLIGARQRGGAEAWEIDYLLDATKDQEVAVELLEHATVEAGKEGAHKLFLRLPRDGDLLDEVHLAGFTAYQEETLYARDGFAAAPATDLRPAVASDSYPLFRLYCETTPEATRRLEAATFGEWHAAQERRWARNGLHLVQENGGQVRTQVRGSRLPQGLALEIISAGPPPDINSLVATAQIAADSTDAAVFILLPDSADSLARCLQDAGFEAKGQFVSLLRRTAKPLTLPKKVAVVAENAIGV